MINYLHTRKVGGIFKVGTPVPNEFKVDFANNFDCISSIPKRVRVTAITINYAKYLSARVNDTSEQHLDKSLISRAVGCGAGARLLERSEDKESC